MAGTVSGATPENIEKISDYLYTGMPLRIALPLAGFWDNTYFKWRRKSKKGINPYVNAIDTLEKCILCANVVDFYSIISEDEEPLKEKKCHRCNNVYNIQNFGKDKTRSDGYKHWCKDCEKIWRTEKRDQHVKYCKEYYYANHERMLESKKEDRLNNIKKYKKKDKNYYINNLSLKKERDRLYRINHKDVIKARVKKYRESGYLRVLYRKYEHERRSLGFSPINEYFHGSHFHHFIYTATGLRDTDLGVYIPKELHRSIWHNGNTGKGMKEINRCAIEWYLNNCDPDHEELQKLGFSSLIDFVDKYLPNIE